MYLSLIGYFIMIFGYINVFDINFIGWDSLDY